MVSSPASRSMRCIARRALSRRPVMGNDTRPLEYPETQILRKGIVSLENTEADSQKVQKAHRSGLFKGMHLVNVPL